MDESVMHTSINGEPAPWTDEIRKEWDRVMEGIVDLRPVSRANYYTPRPAIDQYNRGSRHFGFTYTRGRQVFQVQWIGKE